MNSGGARAHVWRWIPHYGVVALIGLSAGIVGLVQARARREPIAVSVVALLINLLLCLVSVFFLAIQNAG